MTRSIRRPTIAIVAVVVPARDEARLVGSCLDSLVAARAELARTHPKVRARLLVVADTCTDDTASIVRRHRRNGVRLLSIVAGRVGEARATGIRHLLPRRLRSAPRVWIASTDADSTVPIGWLSHQVELADAGADVMVGTVRPDPRDLTAQQNAAWRATHPPGMPNGHVHGANLGVRASSYSAAGGFDHVSEHEDNLLVDRLRAVAVVVASDAAEVVTSGRFEGRTAGGYAGHLRETLPAAPGCLEPEVTS